MSVFLTTAAFARDLVTALCTTIVAIFIFLAYFEPMTLDMLVHQAHDLIPVAIDKAINNTKALF